MQNDIGNSNSPTTVICPLTSKQKKHMPTHVDLWPKDGVAKPSTVLCEQPMTIDKSLILQRLGVIKNEEKIKDIGYKLMVSLGVC